MRRLFRVVRAIVLLTLFSQAHAIEPIGVGVLHSLSGTMATSEAVLADVALMAIEEINAKGGVLGRTLETFVADPASKSELFAQKARELISTNKVAVVFGGFTQQSLVTVLPVFADLNGLLFFPAAYGDVADGKNAFYTGISSRQRAAGTVEYLINLGVKRFVLVSNGSPFARSNISALRNRLKSNNVGDSEITEKYLPSGQTDFQEIATAIKEFSHSGARAAVISTIYGDSNVPFYKELGNHGLKATDVPVVAFSVGEEELRGVDTKPLVGHLAAWNYFMSLKNPANAEFTKKWADYAKKKGIAGHKDKPLTNDPMEATYIGIYMWKQAVEKAKSTDTDKVIAAMAGQTFKAPSGVSVKMGLKSHRLARNLFIGAVRADGQFDIVWTAPPQITIQTEAADCPISGQCQCPTTDGSVVCTNSCCR